MVTIKKFDYFGNEVEIGDFVALTTYSREVIVVEVIDIRHSRIYDIDSWDSPTGKYTKTTLVAEVKVNMPVYGNKFRKSWVDFNKPIFLKPREKKRKE